jgi:Mn2+/Fe2+ NRAMP family transporter
VSPSPFLRRIALAALLGGWILLALWTFSLSFSDSFFRYNLPSRLPPFLAASLGAVVLPVSLWFHWARVSGGRASAAGAWLRHSLVAAASLLPLVATAFLLHRAPEPFHPSADDAMGTGIDFLILAASAIASSVLFGLVLLVRRAVRSGRAA